jgi:hypothetical protein
MQEIRVDSEMALVGNPVFGTYNSNSNRSIRAIISWDWFQLPKTNFVHLRIAQLLCLIPPLRDAQIAGKKSCVKVA